MASNAASSVQFRVNGTEMARGRTRKTERSQSMDPRAKPRAAGRLKGKRRDNRDEREFILGPENAGNFCIARRSRGISAIVSRRLPRRGLLDNFGPTSGQQADGVRGSAHGTHGGAVTFLSSLLYQAFHLLSHRLKVPLHPIYAHGDAVDERE